MPLLATKPWLLAAAEAYPSIWDGPFEPFGRTDGICLSAALWMSEPWLQKNPLKTPGNTIHLGQMMSPAMADAIYTALPVEVREKPPVIAWPSYNAASFDNRRQFFHELNRITYSEQFTAITEFLADATDPQQVVDVLRAAAESLP